MSGDNVVSFPLSASNDDAAPSSASSIDALEFLDWVRREVGDVLENAIVCGRDEDGKVFSCLKAGTTHEEAVFMLTCALEEIMKDWRDE